MELYFGHSTMSIKLKRNDYDTEPSPLSFIIFVYIVLKVLQHQVETLYLIALK